MVLCYNYYKIIVDIGVGNIPAKPLPSVQIRVSPPMIARVTEFDLKIKLRKCVLIVS